MNQTLQGGTTIDLITLLQAHLNLNSDEDNKIAMKLASAFLDGIGSERQNSLRLYEALGKIAIGLKICDFCHYYYLKGSTKGCYNCYRTKKQEVKTICIVKDFNDSWRAEASQTTLFSFHILGGLLSNSRCITPDNLNIDTLIARLEIEEQELPESRIEEVFFMLDKSQDGILTENHIKQILKNKFPWLKITTIAVGIPSGTKLETIEAEAVASLLETRINC
jgi:recombination protein RecR